jgi:hypothetical protein
MMIIRKYKRQRSGRTLWEYKIIYQCFYSRKPKIRKKGGFHSKQECEMAAAEVMGYLKQKI